MVAVVGQKEGRGRHGVEQLHNLGTRGRTQVLEICGNVVDDSQESRVDGCEFALAGANEAIDGLVSQSASSVHKMPEGLPE